MQTMSVLKKILSYEWNPFVEKKPKPEWEFLKEIKNLEELEEFLREVEGFLEELKRKYQSPPYTYEDEEIEEDASNAGTVSVLLDYLADPVYENFNPLPFPKDSIPKELIKKAQRLSEELRDLSDRLEEYLQPTFKTVKVSEEEALKGLKEIEEKLNQLKGSDLDFKELDRRLLELREELQRFEPFAVDFLGKDFLETSEGELKEEHRKRLSYSVKYRKLEEAIEDFHREVLKRWIESVEVDDELLKETKMGEFAEDTIDRIKQVAKQRAITADRERFVKDLAIVWDLLKATERAFGEPDHTEVFRGAIYLVLNYAVKYAKQLRNLKEFLPGFEAVIDDLLDEYLKLLKFVSKRYSNAKTLQKAADDFTREVLLLNLGLDPKRFNPPLPNERLFKLLGELSPEEFEELRKRFGLKGNFDGIEG